MKIIRKITKTVAAMAVLATFPTFAYAEDNVTKEKKPSSYGAEYYENEGPLVLKLRANYINGPAKYQGLPTPKVTGKQTPGQVFALGYGGDAALSFFFTEHLASELSLGVNIFRNKRDAIKTFFDNYGTGTYSGVRNHSIYTVPISATMKFHLAPYGGISPYVGGGAHLTYAYTRNKAFDLRTGGGAVLQTGIDFIMRDDTILNLDVRKFWSQPKIVWKKEFLGLGSSITATDLRTKIKQNPLVIAFGIGFKL